MKGYNTIFVRHALLAVAACLCAPGLVRAQGQMAVEFYHPDAQGNVLALTDSNGSVVESHDYDVFGQEVNAQAGTQPKRFTGKERDTETGWDYFGARYYGSKIGRFTTVDPVYTWRDNLVDPQRWNRYAYGRNNPLRFVDPDGRAFLPGALLGGTIGGALGFGGSVFAQRVRTGSFSEINFADARAAAFGGAVSGALAGGTLGLSLLAEAGLGTVVLVNAGANAAGGAVARATDSSNTSIASDPKELAIDAAVGALGGAAGFGLQRSAAPQLRQLEKTREGMQAAARAGDFGAGSGARGIAGQIEAGTREAQVGATVLGAQITNQAAPIVREAVQKREQQ